MKRWKLMEAKVVLGRIVKSLDDEGPQVITLRGEPTAVLISLKQYEEKFGKIVNDTKSKE